MGNPARTVRRAGLAAAGALLAGALVADATGRPQLRLLLWIAAGLAAAPALLHAVLYGPPTQLQPTRKRPAPALEVPPAPAVPHPRVARGGLPPSPKPRQLAVDDAQGTPTGDISGRLGGPGWNAAGTSVGTVGTC